MATKVTRGGYKDTEYKRCPGCEEIKPRSEFGVRSDGYSESRCPPCKQRRKREWRAENPEKERAQWRRWYEKGGARTKGLRREADRRSRVRRRYGLTLEEYDALVAGGCALCGSHKHVRIDHDHDTGRVRDALCTRCNAGLGFFGDDPTQLREAADYLDKHRLLAVA